MPHEYKHDKSIDTDKHASTKIALAADLSDASNYLRDLFRKPDWL